MLIVNFFDH